MLGHLKTGARMIVGIPIAILYLIGGGINYGSGKLLEAFGVDVGSDVTQLGCDQMGRGKDWVTP